jgi:hypothetical protein
MNSINLGDFTLDGWVDLLVRVAATGQLKLYPHTTNVSAPYSGEGNLVGDSGFAAMNAITVSDLNLDGRNDLLVRMAANGNLMLYPHSGNPLSPFSGSTLVGSGFSSMNDLD